MRWLTLSDLIKHDTVVSVIHLNPTWEILIQFQPPHLKYNYPANRTTRRHSSTQFVWRSISSLFIDVYALECRSNMTAPCVFLFTYVHTYECVIEMNGNHGVDHIKQNLADEKCGSANGKGRYILSLPINLSPVIRRPILLEQHGRNVPKLREENCKSGRRRLRVRKILKVFIYTVYYFLFEVRTIVALHIPNSSKTHYILEEWLRIFYINNRH